MTKIYKTKNSLNVKSLGHTTLSPCEQSLISSFSIYMALPLMQWFHSHHPKFGLLKFAKLLSPTSEWLLQN